MAGMQVCCRQDPPVLVPGAGLPLTRLLQQNDELVHFIDAKYGWITEWPQVVVLGLSIPDDQIVKDKTDLGHSLREVAVKWEESILLSQIHQHDAAVRARLQYRQHVCKNRLQ